MLNELLGNEITVGREHMCRDAERHADALRYVDGLMVECIELSLRNMPGNEIDGPLHWRLRKGREKLRAAVESLERGYLVEVPNALGNRRDAGPIGGASGLTD